MGKIQNMDKLIKNRIIRIILSLTLLYSLLFGKVKAQNVDTAKSHISNYPSVLLANSTNEANIMVYDLFYITPKKGSVGAWGFIYADPGSLEILLGPAVVKKNLMYGLGIGYDIVQKSSAIACTYNIWNNKDEFYIYLEKSNTYWHQVYFEHTIHKYMLGIYSQTGIGNGISFGRKSGKRKVFSVGLGYDFPKKVFIPSIKLSLNFD